jgi:hypothetical protein
MILIIQVKINLRNLKNNQISQALMRIKVVIKMKIIKIKVNQDKQSLLMMEKKIKVVTILNKN